MISSLLDIVMTVDGMTAYLQDRGVGFDEKGFPLLAPEIFLDEWPIDMVPFKHRNAPFIGDPSDTLLCFFAADTDLYPRIDRVLDDLPEYRRFKGAVMMDATVTQDMDLEWQGEIMLLNQLFMSVLAVNNVPVVANLRTGSRATFRHLDAIPQNVMWAAGFLGCAPLQSNEDSFFLEKVLRVRPSKLILYGRQDKTAEEQLNRFGINWRRYNHVRERYFDGKVKDSDRENDPPAPDGSPNEGIMLSSHFS